jgi:hypothetical protein
MLLIGKGGHTGAIGRLAALGFVVILTIVFPPLYGLAVLVQRILKVLLFFRILKANEFM